MCPSCYATYVVPLGLAGEFGYAEHEGLGCHFAPGRAKALLLARAMDELRAYFAQRVDVKPCPGTEGSTAADGIKWFLAGGDIMACEACYEDTVRAAPATEARWVSTPQAADQVWSCDMNLAVLQRMYFKLEWDEWLALARRRTAAPECQGADVRADSRPWYTTRRPVQGFIICETCYLSFVLGSGFEHEFVPEDLSANPSAEVSCDMGIPCVQIPWVAASGRGGFDVFHTAVSEVFASTIRVVSGGDAPLFYAIDPALDFDICERCCHGMFTPLGMAQFLQQRPPGPRACDTCPGTARGTQYMLKVLEMLNTGVWTTFSAFVRKLASIPVCPGRKIIENGRWYGWSRLKICPDCWENFASDTSLASQVQGRDELVKDLVICSLYSPRMRALWSEACVSGDLESLLQFADSRGMMYVNTIMEADRLQTMMVIDAANAAMQGVHSVQYQGMHNMSVLMGTTGNTEYGNSSLGWFQTSAGATAAQLGLSSQQGWAKANSVDRHMEIALLRAKWTEVE